MLGQRARRELLRIVEGRMPRPPRLAHPRLGTPGHRRLCRLVQRHPAAQRARLPHTQRVRSSYREGGAGDGSLIKPSTLSVQAGQSHVRDLRVETESLTVQRTPVPCTKGSLDQLILTLGSAGVFTTALDVLRIWLGRDKTRSVDLTYRDREGQEQHFSVTAQHADRETLAPLIAAVAV